MATDIQLLPKRAAFVLEYLIDLNATQAAIRAGYSAKTARAQGQRMLTDAAIQAAISEATLERSKRTEVTQDMVVLELARLGFSNMADYVTWGPGGVTLKPSNELTENQARAVVEVSEVTTKEGSTVKFKLHDKKGPLELLGKHLQMFIERKELSGPGGKPLAVTLWDVLQSAVSDDDDTNKE